MIKIKRMDHIAVIVSSEKCVDFYKTLGFCETRRLDRGYDVIVWLDGYGETLEIFIDGTHPARVTNPEALGLRHIAFEVDDVDDVWNSLREYMPESIRTTDDGTKMFFVKDPDGLPIEFRGN